VNQIDHFDGRFTRGRACGPVSVSHSGRVRAYGSCRTRRRPDSGVEGGTGVRSARSGASQGGRTRGRGQLPAGNAPCWPCCCYTRTGSFHSASSPTRSGRRSLPATPEAMCRVRALGGRGWVVESTDTSQTTCPAACLEHLGGPPASAPTFRLRYRGDNMESRTGRAANGPEVVAPARGARRWTKGRAYAGPTPAASERKHGQRGGEELGNSEEAPGGTRSPQLRRDIAVVIRCGGNGRRRCRRQIGSARISSGKAILRLDNRGWALERGGYPLLEDIVPVAFAGSTGILRCPDHGKLITDRSETPPLALGLPRGSWTEGLSVQMPLHLLKEPYERFLRTGKTQELLWAPGMSPTVWVQDVLR
jgi:hypothetical protein